MQGPSASHATDAAALLAAGGAGGGGAAPTAVALQAAALVGEVVRERHPAVLAEWAPLAQDIATAAAVFSIASDVLPKPGNTYDRSRSHRNVSYTRWSRQHTHSPLFCPLSETRQLHGPRGVCAVQASHSDSPLTCLQKQ